MGLTYFATDGSFGDATGLVIIDTSDWDQDDWDHVGFATDNERLSVAREISESNPDQLQLPFGN